MTVSHLGRAGGSRGLAVFRQRRFLPLCLFLLFPGASVQAQRLLDLGPVIVEPVVSEPGVVPYAIDLDIDLIRSAPQRLEVPAPDGRLLVAELSVFEDRGDGDAMWAGRVAGSDYESVVFTVANDYLAGHFGVPGGAKYRISARPGGRGRIEDMSTLDRKPKEEYCPGGVVPDRPGPAAAIEAQHSHEPERVVQASSHNHLDMLILYSENARERYEARDGSVDARLQESIDYLNLVFRNGELDLVARLVHHEQAPDSLTITNSGSAVLGRMANNREVQALRAEHQADLVHIFVTAEVSGVCGIAYLLGKGDTAASFSPTGYGLTVMQGCGDETFAHEVGHNLGGNHDPPNTSCFENADCRNNEAIAPYAFGHTWFSGSSPNPPDKDTIMSYGSGEVEPWFSTVRVQPRIDGHAVTLGIAGERENERALREVSVPIAPHYSDSLRGGPGPGPDPEPPPPGSGPTAPGNLTHTKTGPTSVRLNWVDRSDDETGFEVQVRQAGGRWRTHSTHPANTTTADVKALTPGKRYDFRVRAFNNRGRSASNVVTIAVPAVKYSECMPTEPLITFEHGYTVSMCVEYLKGGVGPIVKDDAKDYELESRESGILYFFEKDNAEVLVKVLNPCEGPANNGYFWVFVAPVTTLAFNLYVTPPDGGDPWIHRNPLGGATATTKSDVRAFPCDGSAAASPVGDETGSATDGVELVDSGLGPVSVRQAVGAGEATECEPQPVLTLGSGYEVAMCYETPAGDVGAARDWGLDSDQSGLLYFFDRGNAEVLVKVLESACSLPNNDHVWVYVAPVTDLAFNLEVRPPDGGEPWTHSNNLSRTAAAKSDNKAFACAR